MGTRNTITVMLKAKDRKRPMKFNPALIEYPYTRKVRHGKPEAQKALNETSFNEFHCPGNKTALRAYCQFDGYPDGVGKELNEHYGTYEKALNLVLAGPLEAICSDQTGGGFLPCNQLDPYNIRPQNEFVTEKAPTSMKMDAAYNYLFKDGQWHVKPEGTPYKEYVTIIDYLKAHPEQP